MKTYQEVKEIIDNDPKAFVDEQKITEALAHASPIDVESNKAFLRQFNDVECIYGNIPMHIKPRCWGKTTTIINGAMIAHKMGHDVVVVCRSKKERDRMREQGLSKEIPVVIGEPRGYRGKIFFDECAPLVPYDDAEIYTSYPPTILKSKTGE